MFTTKNPAPDCSPAPDGAENCGTLDIEFSPREPDFIKEIRSGCSLTMKMVLQYVDELKREIITERRISNNRLIDAAYWQDRAERAEGTK